MFERDVPDELGYYVYLLTDGNAPFYVGKGKGNRPFQHLLDAQDTGAIESAKIAGIRRIRDRGREPGIVILRHRIPSEAEAYRIESVAIDLLSRQLGLTLTNCVGGHHGDSEGLMTADEVVALYDAPPIEMDDTPVILFRIPKLWHRGMDPAELYEATRGWWLLDPNRAAKAQFVFAVSRSVVRQIYRPDSWRKRERGEAGWTIAEDRRPRFGFDGSIALDAPAHWLNHNVQKFLPPGFQGPARYLNC